MRFAAKSHPRRVLARASLPGALIISCTFALQLLAQATGVPAPSVGSRVRIVAGTATAPVVGTLLARRSDSLVVGREKDTIAVVRSDITSIDQSLGTHHRVMKGMGLGLVVGASLGAILGALTYEPCHQTGFAACIMAPTSAGENAVMGGIVVAVPGLLIGAIAGLATTAEKWVPVGVESVTQFRIVPRAKGVVAQLSFSF